MPSFLTVTVLSGNPLPESFSPCSKHLPRKNPHRPDHVPKRFYPFPWSMARNSDCGEGREPRPLQTRGENVSRIAQADARLYCHGSRSFVNSAAA